MEGILTNNITPTSKKSERKRAYELFQMLSVENLYNRKSYYMRVTGNLFMIGAEAECIELLIGCNEGILGQGDIDYWLKEGFYKQELQMDK